SLIKPGKAFASNRQNVEFTLQMLPYAEHKESRDNLKHQEKVDFEATVAALAFAVTEPVLRKFTSKGYIPRLTKS
ncbi:hypothetical protein L195_g045857, partial [Trifolium pratense]